MIKILNISIGEGGTTFRDFRDLEGINGKYWPNNEICMRHAEGVRGDNPVLAKLWYFWTNHFTISDTQSLAGFSTGAYQREFIRANMDKQFETMAYEGTVAWPMIMHLDNKEFYFPKQRLLLEMLEKSGE